MQDDCYQDGSCQKFQTIHQCECHSCTQGLVHAILLCILLVIISAAIFECNAADKQAFNIVKMIITKHMHFVL